MADSQLTTARLEAFSDGVIAVIITIMVLELKVPSHELTNIEGLRHLAPIFCVYLLSFIQVGIYWVNHHYMMDDVEHVTHGLLWSNLAFLFTLSLFPFAANWVGERGISPFSIALYAACSVLPAFSWIAVSSAISCATGKPSTASTAKQAVSALLYLGAIPMAYVQDYVAIAMLIAVATLWLIPPRAVVEKTRALRQNSSAPGSPDSR
jgi:uncharacterized membrane protein